MLPNESRAVMVTGWATPAVVDDGIATCSELAVAAITAMVMLLGAIAELLKSVTVIDWLPAVFSVANRVRLFCPEKLAGRIACGSLLLKCKVSANPPAILP